MWCRTRYKWGELIRPDKVHRLTRRRCPRSSKSRTAEHLVLQSGSRSRHRTEVPNANDYVAKLDRGCTVIMTRDEQGKLNLLLNRMLGIRVKPLRALFSYDKRATRAPSYARSIPGPSPSTAVWSGYAFPRRVMKARTSRNLLLGRADTGAVLSSGFAFGLPAAEGPTLGEHLGGACGDHRPPGSLLAGRRESK